MQEFTFILLTAIKTIFFLITLFMGYKLHTFEEEEGDEEVNINFIKNVGVFVAMTSILLLFDTYLNIL
tara:strand:+ start:63 stop:266 length:204 start_codon:yes stop_codon:yes gene_type:complete